MIIKERTFKTYELADAIGIPRQTLVSHIGYNRFVPSIHVSEGIGKKGHVWSLEDMRKISFFFILTHWGIPPGKAFKAIEEFWDIVYRSEDKFPHCVYNYLSIYRYINGDYHFDFAEKGRGVFIKTEKTFIFINLRKIRSYEGIPQL